MAWYPAPRDKSNGDWRRSGMLTGRTLWTWGGGSGQPDYAYLLPQWVDGMMASPRAFHFTRFEAGQTEAPFAWKVLRHSSKGAWPPPMEIPAHVVTWVVVE